MQLLILNISSLQLIPVNVIAFRSQYGSVDPTAIVGAGIGSDGYQHGNGNYILQDHGSKKYPESVKFSGYLC